MAGQCSRPPFSIPPHLFLSSYFPSNLQSHNSHYSFFFTDLSKNRFAELPDEVTEYPFLEKLQLYHNAIRVIPDTVVMLQSLSYLDLR